MRLLRKITAGLLRAIALATWCVLGVWVALATFFTLPAPLWIAASIAAAIVIVFVAAIREPVRLHKWFAAPWRQKRLTTISVAVASIVLISYLSFVKPDSNQEWEPEHARVPAIT